MSEKDAVSKKHISCLINILNIYKNRVNGYQTDDSQKKIMKAFSISDNYPENHLNDIQDNDNCL